MERKFITAAERGARKERIIKSRVIRVLSDAEAEKFMKSQAAQPLIKGEQVNKFDGQLYVIQAARQLGDDEFDLDARALVRVDEATGRDTLVAWINRDGSFDAAEVQKTAVTKQAIAAPATVGEQSADTATQAADRRRIEDQYRLERRLQELQSRLDDSWESGGGLERERRLLEQIDATILELDSLRDMGTRVVRVSTGELALVKVDERIPDAFAFRGGQSFTADAAAGIQSDLIKGVADECLGIRKDESLTKAADVLDLSNLFGVQHPELYK